MKCIKHITGLDASYSKKLSLVFGAAVLLEFPTLQVLEKSISELICDYPYIPGRLFRREGKALLAAYEGLKTKSNLLFVDGNGTLHPKKFGIAARIGKLLAVPTIGCAKNKLIGNHEPVDFSRGSFNYIYSNQGEQLGICLRTRTKIKPVYISVGYKFDLDRAMEMTIILCKYRIPEPIRQAHRFATEYRNAIEKRLI